MSAPKEDARPLMCPPISHEPFLEPGAGQVEQATETTHLLNSPGKPASRKEVHYRNIDGTRFWWLFGSIIFGNTIAFFDSTVTASSHPVITSYFNASNSASWLSTVFYLTSTVFQPVYGRVSDTVGRRPVYIWAGVVFFLSTAWCALAQSIGSFIAARAVCGFGAGGVMAISSIVTSDIVKIEYRGIYQSYYNLAYGFGNGLGAALGGFLCDRLGWRAAFGVQLPFIFVFILMTYFATPADLGPNLAKSQGKTIIEAFKTFDSTGAACLTLAVTSLILGINLGGNVLTWTHPIVLTSLVLALLAGIALVPISRRATLPLLPLPLLTKPPISNLMWASFLSSIVTNTVLFNIPLFLQAVRLTTPTTSGLYLISPLIGVSLSAVFSGYYITYTRALKPMMTVGVLFLLLGSLSTTSLTPTLPLWTLLLLIPSASIGQGFFFPAVTIAVLALNSQADTAVVTTTLGLLRSLGAIHGVAVSSWILQNSLPYYLERSVTAETPALRDQIIQSVRRSVGAIKALPARQRGEVQRAYAQALRVTFAGGIVFAVVVVALVVPVALPRLQRQAEMDVEGETEGDEEAVLEDDDEEEDGGGGMGEPLGRRPSCIHAAELGRRASFDTSY